MRAFPFQALGKWEFPAPVFFPAAETGHSSRRSFHPESVRVEDRLSPGSVRFTAPATITVQDP